MKKADRIKTANNTLEIIKTGEYTNQKGELVLIEDFQKTAEKSTKVYTPQWLDLVMETATIQRYHETTEYELTDESTLAAARRLYGSSKEAPLALNFASAKHPGGGFLNGADGQEESLVRASGLYPCLTRGQMFYSFHRRQHSGLYSDHLILSSGVPVFKDDEGNLLDEPFPVSILSASAVNVATLQQQEKQSMPLIRETMEARAKKILFLANSFNFNQLILGAWGCGPFRHEPGEIASLFHRILMNDYKGAFKKVVFAIDSKNESFRKPFQKRFAPPAEK
jgi:uncharacterized protein (TIGR02452 family)